MVDTCVSGAYEEIRGGSSPPFGTIKQIEVCPQICFIVRIGFQDSLDAFLLAMTPSCLEFEAYL